MEFPGLGAHCALGQCNRLDFLPMKCDSCHKNFCNEHFRYEEHDCPGERRTDVQVPTCPLCSAPVPGKRGQAPDVAVSAHIDDDCQADPAKSRRNKIFTNRCAFKGCKGKEMVKLVCSECSMNFCFKHRHGIDHHCEGKKNAIRRRLEEAAVSRVQSRQTSNSNISPNNCSSESRNVFAEVQGTMSEDEALARALALSMQEEPSPRPSGTSPQRVGGDQNPRCTIS